MHPTGTVTATPVLVPMPIPMQLLLILFFFAYGEPHQSWFLVSFDFFEALCQITLHRLRSVLCEFAWLCKQGAIMHVFGNTSAG
jgi:hypothetical protein